jgi:Protein of unknown function (DUF1552)
MSSQGFSLSRWELRRRTVLKSLGLGAAMLPLLTETQARAQNTGPLGRLMVVVKPNGCRPETFWPTWPGARPADGSLATAKLSYSTTSLEKHKDKLMFLDGIKLRNWYKSEGNTTGDSGDAHHNWGSLLTGELPSNMLLTEGGCRVNETPAGCRMYAGSVSLDCYVGREAKKKDSGIIFESIHASLNADDLAFARRAGGVNCPSWFDRDKPNAPEPSPVELFKKLFGGSLPTAGNAPDPRNLSKIRLLEAVSKDLERFQKRLGTDDRARIEEHLENVKRRQDELNQLLSAKAAACQKPATPTMAYIARQEANIPAQSKLMIDLLVDAMKCGLSRSAVYSIYDSNAYAAYFSWLKTQNSNFSSGSGGGPKISEFPDAHFHAMAHGNNADPGKGMYADANRWMVEQYAYLVNRLSSESDLTGTMLDNTLVLWVDSLSDGGGHSVNRLPMMLAGNVNKRLRQGRHIQMTADTAANGVWAAIAEAIGTPTTNGGFGNPKFDIKAKSTMLA